MSYPGNPSLSPDVQAKTKAIFEQTLRLVAQGRDQEALAGCEFILGLDPLFQPAHKLRDRLRSGERPVRLDDLSAAQARPPGPGPAPRPPAPPARPPLNATAQDDDLLDLQRRSLSLDPEDDEPLFGLDAEAPLDVSDLDDDLDLDADSDLEDLEDLDLDALPDLEDSEAPEAYGVPAGAETLPFGAETLALGDETVSFGEDTVALGQGEAFLDLGEEPALPPAGPRAAGPRAAGPRAAGPRAAPPIGPIPGMPVADDSATNLVFDEQQDALDDTRKGMEDEGGAERIAELLDEGQAVFEQGDYQGAIDVWSRIFLIDISNGPASQRIEEARRKKAELERQAEEIFHEGVGHIESRSLEEAKEAFRRVLEIADGHSMAREYLEQLEAGKVPTIVTRSSEAAELEALGDAAAGGRSAGSPSLEAAVRRDRIVVVKKTDKRLVALAALVAVVVVGGGGYVFFNRNKLFPNTTQAAPTAPMRIDPILRATRLYEAGEAEKAIEALQGLPADDPAYEKGRALVDQWQAQIAAQEQVSTGPSPELLERRNLLLAAARISQKERRFLKARRYFERAHKILPLDSEDMALKLNCDAELRSLAEEVRKFRDREYTAILRGLWQRRDEEPGNLDIDRLIVDSYYNLSLLDLQRGDAGEAASKLQEALGVDPEDQDLQRLHLFAEAYSKRSQDLLYKIFVKHLPERDL